MCYLLKTEAKSKKGFDSGARGCTYFEPWYTSTYSYASTTSDWMGWYEEKVDEGTA